jgi:hypothetical protein
MKSTVRKTVQKIIQNDRIWNYLPSNLKSQDFIRVQRTVAVEQRFRKNCLEVFKKQVVLNGPFTGLHFPYLETQGSAVLPRLVGSYESELHQTLTKVLQKPHSLVIDIGFAEGYYLVGLATKLPNTKFIGFDISLDAHRLCAQLASANSIPVERLLLLSKCSIESLSDFLPSSSLLICDCEGFEAELFTWQSKSLWRNSDIIIECHDFIKPGIRDFILSLLRETHKMRVIETATIESKLSFLDSLQFDVFNKQEKMRLVNEGRPCIQAWIVAEPL